MAAENEVMDIDEALDKAFKDSEGTKDVKDEKVPDEKAKKGTVEETADEQEEETETEEKPTEPEKSDDEDADESSTELDEDTKDAIALWKELEGPNAAAIIKEMAERAGLRIVTPEEKKELSPTEKKKVLTTTEIARKALGEDYAFIADKIAEILDTVLEERVEKPLRISKEQQEVQAITNAVSTFGAANPGAEKFGNEIVAMIHEMPPRPGADLQVYLGRIYKLVSGDKDNGNRTSKVIKKIEENSKRATTRASEVSEKTLKKGPKLPDIDEALDAAFQNIAFEDE